MKIKFWITLLFSSVLFFQTNKAQNVYAQVSSKQVQAGVPFEYAIVIGTNPNSYSPPNFGNLQIVGGPNQSSSTQWVNGQTSFQMTLSWQLVAPREGKYTIGVASVFAGQQKFETQAITIEATKGAPQQQSGGNNAQANNGTNVGGSDLFIRTMASKTKCYIGEQITITQKVYSRLQIVGFQKFAQPTYDGFYSQAQESASKGQLAVENVDGVNYYTYELFRTIAIANKSGKISLTPVEGDVVIRKASSKPRNVFEQFFGGGFEDVPIPAKSKSLTIEVLELPENGKPENFNGAVGNFSCKINVSRNEVKANDAFNLKMTISGNGNLKLINAPNLDLPESFESYEPKVSENGNSKTFDYLIIPRSEGDYTLEKLDFSYFNLDTKKYVTIPNGEIKIKVLPPDANSANAQVYTPQSQVKQTTNDIRYIKKGDFTLTKNETEFFNSLTHIVLLLLPVILLGVGLYIRRDYIKKNSNAALVKERKAARMAKKQLTNAEKLMAQNKKDEFYTEILTALNNYIGNKLNIPVADLSRERIQKSLQARQVDATITSKFIATLETSEYAKYAPGAVSGNLQQVYKDTVDLITNLEENLNKKA